MTAHAHPAPDQGSRRLLVLALGAGLALILLETVRDLVAPPNPALSGFPWQLAFQNVVWWGTWVALSPIVALVCRRASFFGGRPWRTLAIHAVAALVLGGLHAIFAAQLFALWPADAARWPGVVAVTGMLLRGFLVLDVMTYAAIVAVVHAVQYADRLRRQEADAARLRIRASELERALATARLDALRAQLNPHFLFNTLNSVAGLVRRGDGERAVLTIAQLGDLLRESLALGGEQTVSLAHELALLDRYLAIELTRLAGRLAVAVEVSPDVEGALVPTLLLQPLAENAIRHGVATWPLGGRLSVRAHRQGDDLVLSVENRPSAAVPGPAVPRRPEGVGLGNTRERLAELYGQRGRLALEFLPDGGCHAEVVLPLERPAGIARALEAGAPPRLVPSP